MMRKSNKSAGFSLTELAISLVIIALIMSFFMSTGTAFVEIQKNEASRTKLKAIETALAGYVAIHGRLPCPADGSLTNVSPLNGVGVCGTNQQHGVVPWVTLGMSESDILDGWFNRITYRVGPNLWLAGAMDMTSCDTAGTGLGNGVGVNLICQTPCSSAGLSSCTSPQTFLQAGKGLNIQDRIGGTLLMDATASPTEGAAYVLISHGRNGAGARQNETGALVPTTNAGNDELVNANNLAVRIVSPDNFYVDRNINDNPGAAYFDDLVQRPSILKVIIQAQRGPRAH